MQTNFDIKTFAALSSPVERCSFLWDHYVSRKRQDSFEPSWVLKPYSLVKSFLDLNGKTDGVFSENDYFVLNETIKSHLQKDGSEVPIKTGFPNEGSRIMHDCWKAGSFSWVFMGRQTTHDIFDYKGFTVLSRTLPDHLYDLLDKDFAPQTLFACYNMLDESKNIGPAVCVDDLLQELEDNHV
jgi:hypothetical protein